MELDFNENLVTFPGNIYIYGYICNISVGLLDMTCIYKYLHIYEYPYLYRTEESVSRQRKPQVLNEYLVTRAIRNPRYAADVAG